MADETKPTKAAKLEGFDAPIKSTENVPEHISEHTLMVKGIDPETKKREAVSLAALKAEFGDDKGRAKYNKIAKAAGFFDPLVDSAAHEFFPDLSLDGLNKDAQARVAAILSE